MIGGIYSVMSNGTTLYRLSVAVSELQQNLFISYSFPFNTITSAEYKLEIHYMHVLHIVTWGAPNSECLFFRCPLLLYAWSNETFS